MVASPILPTDTTIYLFFGTADSLEKYMKSVDYLIEFEDWQNYMVGRYDASKSYIWRSILEDGIIYDAFVEITIDDYRRIHHHLCFQARETFKLQTLTK